MNKITCTNIAKTFVVEGNNIKVLENIDLTIEKGDLVAISGQSGAGKSTLLHIIASLDEASSGNILYDEKPIGGHTNFALSNIRLNNFGFVYQFHHLLEDLTVLENIMIPLQLAGNTKKQNVYNIIDEVGLSSRVNHLPWKLSGGEKQRVAIARALINNPDFIFLDEPTGNLDDKNASIIQNLLLEISKRNNIALVTATHDNNFIESFNKIYYLKDFNLVEA
ncbi:ABC transporter ATP-binding protein [Gammaproteobacteria bacterium]|jgi:lipoprotein-releasing system ATP-binding protein|nr:ABC transporter ATP-binding protein [Gammaproteobacteria bacterium]MDC0421241.1 ABC transporter ATP-binding protein [Gammaproteobacteria bacterium]MDC3245011.1 ABC transporter ATP-binding protein [Gammaproteobacteria bacterium]